MEFHEKSLELNITHELLNLADSWYWFLTDIPLWRYWRPRYRLPFMKFPKSSSGGFHITTEGKNDPTGNAGGGFDVRIKTGNGGHLLFIQYKKGELSTKSPDPKSEFNKTPHDHFTFKINNKKTNQHFLLRNLAKGEGGKIGNAVVYAFPLIADMDELEANSGKLIRKTKFVSIMDIDVQAFKNNVSFSKGKVHNFRVGKFDMSRCEVNFFFFFFRGPDRAKDVIADIIALKFQKTLSYFINGLEAIYREYGLSEKYIPFGMQQSFIQYIRFLLHYFEVSPSKLDMSFLSRHADYFTLDEFKDYESSSRDIEIISATFDALKVFEEFIFSLDEDFNKIFPDEVPSYKPKFLIPANGDNGIRIRFDQEVTEESLEDISYLVI